MDSVEDNHLLKSFATGLIALTIGLSTSRLLGAFSKETVTLSVIMSVLSFALMELIVERRSGVLVRLHYTHFSSIMKTVVEKFHLFSWPILVVIVYLVNPPAINPSFIDWSSISPLQWLRFLAGFLVLLLYPGYGLTKVMFGSERLDKVEHFLISVHLSIFVISVIGVISIIQGDLRLGTSYIILLNIVLFAYTIFQTLSNRPRKHVNLKMDNKQLLWKSSNIWCGVVIVVTIIFYLVSLSMLHFPDTFTPGSDRWKLYGFMLRLVEGPHQVALGLEKYLYVPFGSLFISTAGLPPLNSYMIILILALLPLLSFYLLSRSIFCKETAAVSVAIFSLFSGLGGLYAMYLTLTEGITLSSAASRASEAMLDLDRGVHLFSFDFVPQQLGLSILLILLYLLHRKFRRRTAKFFVVAILFTLGFLTHMTETLLYVAVLPILFIIYRKYIIGPQDLLASIALGIMLAMAFIPVSNLQDVYTIVNAKTSSFVAISVILTLAFCFLMLRINSTKKGALNQVIFVLHRALGYKSVHRLLTGAFSYTCIFGLILWFYAPSPSSLDLINPWYLYPARFGILIFLAIPSILVVRSKEYSKPLRLALALVVIPFAMGQLIEYLLIVFSYQAPISEPRIAIYLLIGLAILCSVTLDRLSKIFGRGVSGKRGGVRKLLVLSLIGLILVSGVSSTFLHLRYIREAFAVYPNRLTGHEVLDMDLVMNHTLPEGVVLAPWPYDKYVEQFAARYSESTTHRSLPYLKTQNPLLFFSAITGNVHTALGRNVSYLLQDKRSTVTEENSFLSQISEYLPIIDETEQIRLLKLPDFAPASKGAEVGMMILQPDVQSQEQLFSILTLSMARLNYTTYLLEDPIAFTSRVSTLFLPRDPDLTPSESARVLEWVSNGGRLVVFNLGEQPNGMFSRYLSIVTDPNTFTINASEAQWNPINSREGGSYNLSLLPDSEASVLKLIITPGEFKKVGIIYELNQRRDWSNFTRLSLMMYGNNTGNSLSVVLHAPDSYNQFHYEFADDFSGWKRIVIPLDDMSLVGSPSLRNVSYVLLTTYPTTSPSITWRLGDIILDEGPASVTGIVGPAGRIDIPKIQTSKCFTDDLEVKILASYITPFREIPFAFHKKVGNGEIVYLMFDSYFQAMKANAGNVTCHTLFSNLGRIIDLLGLPLKKTVRAPAEAYSFIMGANQLHEVVLQPESFYIPNISMYNVTLDLSQCEIPAYSESDSLINGFNLIQFSTDGDFHWVFEGAEANLNPPGTGTYSRIVFPDGFRMSAILQDAELILTLQGDDGISEIVCRKGVVTLVFPPTEKEGALVFMNGANVQATGKSYFEYIRTEWTSEVNLPGIQLKVEGPIDFVIDTTDDRMTLISGLKIGGKYTPLFADVLSWNEFDVTLNAVQSPYFLFSNALIAVLLTLTILVKKRFKRLRNSTQPRSQELV